MSSIFNIPAGIPFAKSLAANLLEIHKGTPESLADILILLPTRRACRTLREAFMQLNNGKPLILPRMQPMGDIDEEELSLSIAGSDTGTQNLLELPPILPNMTRQILLAKAIIQYEDFPHNFDQALALAKTLTHFIDQIYTENLDIRDLAHIVPENFADHWQITLDFLKILSETWPKILADLGLIDSAQRRNALINALADFWQDTKPQKHIIAAGSTGSIPATAKLLKTIANLPNGQIILPGLDTDMDDESWSNLSESHPQFGLKHLLDYIDIPRNNVAPWHSPITDADISVARRILSSELMRPAETTKEWQNLQNKKQVQAACITATKDLALFECDTAQEEAKIIAGLMRGILEHPAKTAALITPDRNLAKRVTACCKRWNIIIDDSAGEPLHHTNLGRFMILVIETYEEKLSPVSLLALLKHPLINKEIQATLPEFEIKLMRGIKPPEGISGLYHQYEKLKDEKKTPELFSLIQKLETLFQPLVDIIATNEKINFKTLLKTHISLCENLHNTENTDTLWSNEDGETAATLLTELLAQSSHFPKLDITEYAQILQQFMAAVTLRPAYGTHPRLQILGQLEARLIDADLVILSGLNEGTWPPEAGSDPWMSRPMRREFGLPGYDRAIGLAAHDFIQGLCAPNVAITRSKLADGAPTVPARWLQRLETVLNAAGLAYDTLKQGDMAHWIAAMDTAEEPSPYERPAPKPPITARPDKMSITKIETWLKDPYSIYAHYILNLKPLDPLEKEADAALRGDILHNALDSFIKQNPKHIPDQAADLIIQNAKDYVNDQNLAQDSWHFYWPRFAKITDQFLNKEEAWRKTAAPYKTEIQGKITFSTNNGDFTLHGRADRIDKTHDNMGAIIDYKSGGQFSKKSIHNGNTPQLPLEALILEAGGFENTPAIPCDYLGYWVLNGKDKNTEITDPHDILVDTKAALITLIDTFQNEDIPYYALPRSNKMLRFNDYEHLARIKEWAALDDSETGEAA